MSDITLSEPSKRRGEDFGESCEEDSIAGVNVPSVTHNLSLENRDLRRKLDDELSAYKQRLSAYQEGQQRQTNLVQRLQSKVLQYKEKCRTLELRLQIAETENQNRKAGMDENTAEYEATLLRLEEEQQRASSLAGVNTMLREQLDQVTNANQTLSSDLQRMKEEVTRLRDVLERREAEWRNEEAAFNDYFTMEHGRLLALWRAVVACRRQFVEVRGQVEREIGSARVELSRVSRICQTACENFASNLRTMEARNMVSIEQEKNEKKKLEHELDELTRSCENARQQANGQLEQANQKIANLVNQLEEMGKQLSDRSRTIDSLQRLRTGQSLCGRKEGADINDPSARALVEETQTLYHTLRDISQSILNDEIVPFEGYSGVENCFHQSRSRSPCYASNPKMIANSLHNSRAGAYGRTGSPPPPVNSTNSCYWADSTLSAVQAALHKRGLQVSDLTAKLNNAKDQCDSIKHQLDDSENERRTLERQLMTLRAELDSVRREKEDMEREIKRITANVQTLDNERADLERLRSNASDEIKSLQSELERVQNAYSELRKGKSTLEEELSCAQRDVERYLRESERCQRCIDALEERLSAEREEGTNLRSALQKAKLEAEIKAKELADIQDALSRAEIRKAEQEAEIARIRSDEAVLSEHLSKFQSKLEEVSNKRSILQSQLRNQEAEYNQLASDYRNTDAERSRLKEALIQMESQKNELIYEKTNISQSLTISEASRERLEEEITSLNKEKLEITEQMNAITRHKNGLTNELIQKNRDTERLRDVIGRLNREKEDLTKDKGELLEQVAGLNRELNQTCDLLTKTKKDHENLDADYYQAKQQIMQLETRRDLLENELQEQNLKRENLLVELKRTQVDLQHEIERGLQAREQASQALQKREDELQGAMKLSKEAAETEISRLRNQLVECRQSSDKELRDLTLNHKEAIKDLIKQSEQDKQDFDNELMKLQREKDEMTLSYEADKQNLLSFNEQERVTLNERLNNSLQQIKGLESEIDRIKREASARHERDDMAKADLTRELKEFRQHYEETCSLHEQALKNVQVKSVQLATERDLARNEVNELKMQVNLLEEVRDGLQKNIAEISRRLKETDEARETLRKEIIDLRRTLAETQRDRDNKEEAKENLVKRVQSLETERVEQNRVLTDQQQQISAFEEQKCADIKEIGELRSSVRESEKGRLDVRRELQEVKRQLKDLQSDRERQTKDLMEMHSRITREEEKNEELRQENTGLKQRNSEIEASRSKLRKELSTSERRICDLQELLSSREREYKQAADHANCEYRRLTDTRNQLETAAEALNNDLAEARLALSGAEGRVTTLEAQLAKSESIRRDFAYKLACIHSSLRRLIGYNQSRHRSKTPSRIRDSSSISPVRRLRTGTSPVNSRENSPVRDLTGDSKCSNVSRLCPGDGSFNASDLDPETVRLALREFVQKYSSVKRDFEDAQAQITSLHSRLNEQAEQTEQWARRLHHLQQALCEAEADKKGVDGKLSSTQTALMLQEETLRQNERDRKTLAEKISQLERQISSLENERREDQEKIMHLRQTGARLEEERRLSRRALDEAENRITQLEVTRRSLEGELQRLKMCVTDKEAENQMLEDRCQNLCKQIQDLESKSQSLQLTVDRLSTALAKTEELESASKDKMQQLNSSLSDNNQTIMELQERLVHLQKALANSEHDRRIIQERLDNTRSVLHEQKHQNQQSNERILSLQNELSDAELRRGELENQIRQTNNMLDKRQESEQELNKQLQAILKERQELFERVSCLQRNLTDVENMRDQLMRSSTHLEKDRHNLRRHLEKAEREKQQNEEIVNKSNLDRTELEITLRRLEEENSNRRKQIQYLQSKLVEMEQAHSKHMNELASRHRAESELELERLRCGKAQAERALEARERAHKQRIKALEDQLATLKDQLIKEVNRPQQLISNANKFPTAIRSEIPSSTNRRSIENKSGGQGDSGLKASLSSNDVHRLIDNKNTEIRNTGSKYLTNTRPSRLPRR
ncbi:Rootletin [Schistosoma japonicum]|nr:Rootletin [Schistosoma japonicum]